MSCAVFRRSQAEDKVCRLSQRKRNAGGLVDRVLVGVDSYGRGRDRLKAMTAGVPGLPGTPASFLFDVLYLFMMLCFCHLNCLSLLFRQVCLHSEKPFGFCFLYQTIIMGFPFRATPSSKLLWRKSFLLSRRYFLQTSQTSSSCSG